MFLKVTEIEVHRIRLPYDSARADELIRYYDLTGRTIYIAHTDNGLTGLGEAEEIENNSNQLLNFTNIIKQNSLDVNKDILKHLWKVIISDNTVDQYESNLMRRICGLIYVPDKICAEVKLKLINSK